MTVIYNYLVVYVCIECNNGITSTYTSDSCIDDSLTRTYLYKNITVLNNIKCISVMLKDLES